ncbi:hypothetical protein CR513_15539, partial [Mucuna pruriens]
MPSPYPASTGYGFLSFMDAHSWYSQIKMHPQDEAKMTFITDNKAFCYKVMPFGLKNVSATYQRLIDRIFKNLLVSTLRDIGSGVCGPKEAHIEIKFGKTLFQCSGQKIIKININWERNRSKSQKMSDHH